MKKISIGNGEMQASEIALGCMRIANLPVDEVSQLINTALDEGINFFDHADIYGAGTSESLFGKVLSRNPGLREKILIQTKCGIKKGYYDLSKEHIVNSVNESLKRLKTDYVDFLLLHRPDTLMDPQEINDAFNILLQEKKVRHFGVSNMNPMQIELLQKHIRVPLVVNQLQFSIVHSGMIDLGFHVNMKHPLATSLDNSILEYCRLKEITIQPWSVVQASWEEGTFLNNPNYQELNDVLSKLAKKYSVTPSAIAIAWILKHPAKMQPIIGTTNPKHLEELCLSEKINLTRPEWYELYTSVGKKMP
mgnify:CR=1 FL=1